MRRLAAACAVVLLLGGAVLLPGQAWAGDDAGSRFAPELTRVYVAAVQTLLAQRGYSPGPATGRVTPRTRRAVAAFQRDAGLPVTGVADMAVVDMLNFGPPIRANAGAPPPALPVLAPRRRHHAPARHHRSHARHRAHAPSPFRRLPAWARPGESAGQPPLPKAAPRPAVSVSPLPPAGPTIAPAAAKGPPA